MFESYQENEVVIFISIAILCMLLLALLVIFFFHYSRNKILQQKNINQQMQIKHQDELLKNNIIIQEQERARIAAELHDDIGVKLSVIRLYVNQIAKHKTKQNDSESILVKTNQILDTTIDTTRRISHELLPPVLEELGLRLALDEFVRETAEASGISIKLDYNNLIKPQAGFIELQIFRIIQELVKNTLNHANASKLRISVDKMDQGLKVAVKDNGKGMDTSEINKSKGLGMKNIQSRAKIINGEICIQSELGNGTETIIEISSKKK